jgi:hypothetical protein
MDFPPLSAGFCHSRDTKPGRRAGPYLSIEYNAGRPGKAHCMKGRTIILMDNQAQKSPGKCRGI